MVDIASLNVRATLGTTEFDRGVQTIKVQLEDISAKTRSSRNDFERLNNTTSSLVSRFSKLGTVGVGALTGLGLTAPAVARDLADIQVTAIDLGMTMGDIIQPAVQFVSESFSRLSQFIGENKDGIRDFVINGVEFLRDSINGVQGVWDFFKNSFQSVSAVVGIDLDLGNTLNFVKDNFPELFGAALGYAVAGRRGAALGIGAGFASRLGGVEEEGSTMGSSERTGGIIGDITGAVTGWWAGQTASSLAISALGFTPAGRAGQIALWGSRFIGSGVGAYTLSDAGAWIGRQFDRNREAFDDIDTEGGNIGG